MEEHVRGLKDTLGCGLVIYSYVTNYAQVWQLLVTAFLVSHTVGEIPGVLGTEEQLS